MYRFLLLVILFNTNLFSQEILDISIHGISDGIINSKQRDRDEAILDAKIKAIERSGLTIQTHTVIEDFKLKKDFIESKAKAYLMPGYNILDIGYGEDKLYHVVLVGKLIKIDINEQKDTSSHLAKEDKFSRIKNARKKLSEMGVPFTKSDLVQRIINNDIYVIDLYLQAGLNPNIEYKYKYDRKDGMEPELVQGPIISIAILHNYIDIVNLFIKHNANLEDDITYYSTITGYRVYTPYGLAAYLDHMNIVNALEKVGARKSIIPLDQY